jgi:alpha-acetolactate decarboxylase
LNLLGLAALLLTGEIAIAQERHATPNRAMPKAGHSNMVSGVRVVGNFQRMLQMQDLEPKGAIRDMVPAEGGYAVGALAGLKGEITAYDGTTFLSYGRTMDGRIATREPGEAEATLLVAAKVDSWTAVPIPTAMTQDDLHAFIVAKAAAAGLDVAEAFPFLIRGEITNYRWHVVAAPNPQFGGHGGKTAFAEQFETSGERMAAEVVGFYSGVRLAGVISHSGEKFHEHVLDPDRTVTGHLDAYDVGAGATLYLPANE